MRLAGQATGSSIDQAMLDHSLRVPEHSAVSDSSCRREDSALPAFPATSAFARGRCIGQALFPSVQGKPDGPRGLKQTTRSARQMRSKETKCHRRRIIEAPHRRMWEPVSGVRGSAVWAAWPGVTGSRTTYLARMSAHDFCHAMTFLFRRATPSSHPVRFLQMRGRDPGQSRMEHEAPPWPGGRILAVRRAFLKRRPIKPRILLQLRCDALPVVSPGTSN